jgi:hypothetical protein
VVGPSEEDAATRVVNDRYRAEHPASLALSLTHDLLWDGTASQYQEVILHALGSMVHLQLLAATPTLGALGTELARRQNSLALTLLNSRSPGSPDISLIAPEGPGTIPGGAAALQTPDFWSIPFVGGTPVATDAPALLGPVLTYVLDPGTEQPTPLRYGPELGELLSTHGARAWIGYDEQWRAARALGALDR